MFFWNWMFGKEEEESPFLHLKPIPSEKLNIPPENVKGIAEIQNILQKTFPPPKDTSPFLVSNCGIYLSGFYSKNNLPLLKTKGITYVINMAHGDTDQRYDHRSIWHLESEIQYLGINAQDSHEYNIMSHWTQVKSFAQECFKKPDNKLLIHCMAGINRSGSLAVALICWKEEKELLEAIDQVRTHKGVILTNVGFQNALISWARNEKYLNSSLI